MTSLRIRQHVIGEVIAHAQADAPNECCGLLLGTDEEIDEVVRARNALQSPTRFYLDPADHFQAIRLARRTNRFVRASYHSHPKGPPHPSPTDAELLGDPDMLVAIVSLAPSSLAVFRWADGNFARIDFVPVP